MLTNLYIIYDRVAEEAGPVFNAVNDAVAGRSYRNLVKDMDPEAKLEYRLYRIATFETKTMSLTCEVNPVEIFAPRPAMEPEAVK